jgi:hypothetical protein
MLKLQSSTFRAFNTDTTSKVRYIEMDKETFIISYFNKNDSLIKTHQLEPTAMKWWIIDPLANDPNQVGKSPYSSFWNNPIRYNDPDGRCPDCPDDVYVPLADQAYDGVVGDISSNGWEIIRVDENDNSGYRGVLYKGTYNGNTVTFNAAGLSNATKNLLGIQNSTANISAYVVQGETVDYYQSKIGLKAEGNVTYLPAQYVPQIPLVVLDDIIRTYQRVQNHMMSVVIQKYNSQKK